MSAAFIALLPVVLLIVAGIVLRHTIMKDEEQWKGVERLTYYLLFPALIIDTLARSDLSRVPVLGVGAALFLAIILMTLICLALRPLLAARLAVDGPAFTSVMQGATRWNTFVALALAGSLFGAEGVALTAVAIVAMIPILNVINVWTLIHYASNGPRNVRAILGALLGNPLIWSCIIGLALNLLGLRLPAPVHSFLGALSGASVACGLLAVGAGLHVAGLMRPAPAMMIATGLKLLLMPAMAIALALLFGVNGAALAVVACCSAVPAPAGTYVLARQMGGDAPLMAQILAFETVLAVATMPVALAIVTLW
jgi:predicted permease